MAPQLTQTERERIIALRLSGCRVIDIIRQTGITKKSVYFWLRRWEESGTLEAHRRQLYSRATTAEEDAAMIAAHSADPSLSTRVTSTSYSVSMNTVRRRLKECPAKTKLMNQAHIESQESSSANKIKVFCPKCNTEVSHTGEGIQEDRTKILIAKVYHYFEREYENLKKMYGNLDLTPLSKFRQRTALATGVSEKTLLQILKEEERRNANRRPKDAARKRCRQTDSSSGENSSDDDDEEPSCADEEEPDIYLPVEVKLESSDSELNTSNLSAIQMEVVADDYQQQTQQNIQSTQPRPYSNAERQRRYREKRKADKINACTFSQSNDVQTPKEQPQYDVQINKRQPQSNAERQRKYRKSLREQQQQQMEDVNAIAVLSKTPRTSIRQRQNVDQAEQARKRLLNKQRQSRFRARRRFESRSTSSHQAHTERSLLQKDPLSEDLKSEPQDDEEETSTTSLPLAPAPERPSTQVERQEANVKQQVSNQKMENVGFDEVLERNAEWRRGPRQTQRAARKRHRKTDSEEGSSDDNVVDDQQPSSAHEIRTLEVKLEPPEENKSCLPDKTEIKMEKLESHEEGYS